MDPLSLRVAARFEAREFSSPEALKNYLHEHPKADPSNHHVVKNKEEKGHGDSGKEHKPHGGFLGGLRGALKNLSKGAKSFLAKAPAKTQKFFTDSEHRKEALKKAGDTIKKAPGTYAKKLVQTAKHEVKEFKLAGGAVKDLMKGQKLSAEQKHAVKTVATHMAITAAAAALTTTGAFAGAAFMGKAMAKHVALKAVGEAMGDLHVLGELGHVGHGLTSLLDKLAAEEAKLDPDDALAALVMKKVQDQLDKLSEEDLVKVLEESGKNSKEATLVQRFAAAVAPEALEAALEDVRRLHSRLQGWIRQAPRVLAQSQKDTAELPSGWVWQDAFVKYWQGFESYEKDLLDLDSRLDDIYLDSEALGDIANMAREATTLPRKAQIEYVLNSFKFFPKEGKDQIAYQTKAIEEWISAFEKWSKDSTTLLKQLTRKANRIKKRL